MMASPLRFSHHFKTTVGVVGSAGAYYSLRASISEVSESLLYPDLPKALGPDRFFSNARDVLEQFSNAPTNALMAHFQVFWPFVLDVNSIAEIDKIAKLPTAQKICPHRQHRIRALPAVSSLHAIPTVGIESIDFLDDIVSPVVGQSLDPSSESPNREILEIIWQNAISAVIRNNENWNSIYFHDTLIRQCQNNCTYFLSGEKSLFFSAIAAYQFLLTYTRALQQRHSDDSKYILRNVEQVIKRIQSYSGSTNTHWFYRLDNLYKSRFNLNDMVPQFSEMLLGWEKFPDEISEFAVLTRLYGAYLDFLIASGSLRTPYISNQRVQIALDNNLVFGPNSNSAFEIWNRARNSELADQFGLQAIRYLDDRFEKQRTREPSYSQKASIWRMLPLHQHDEQNICNCVLGFDSLERVATAINHFGLSPSGVIRMSLPIVRSQAQTFGAVAVKDLTDNKLQALIEEKVPSNILENRTKLLEELKDCPSRIQSSDAATSRAAYSVGAAFGLRPAKPKDVRINWLKYYIKLPFTLFRSHEEKMPRVDNTTDNCFPVWLVHTFACGLAMGIIGVITQAVGYFSQQFSVLLFGAGILALGSLVFALCILKAENIFEARGESGDVSSRNHSTS